jgi:hypothetical protein
MKHFTAGLFHTHSVIPSMVLACVLIPLPSPVSQWIEAQELPTVTERTRGLERNEGFLLTCPHSRYHLLC